VAGALLLSGVTLHNSMRIAIDPKHAAFPARAVEVLKTSGVQGNMAVYFDWGEYALWNLSPKIKVSYDGRRETIYPESLRRLNDDWAHGVGQWDAILDKYPTDLALLDRRLPSYNLMRAKAGWKLVYEDSLCAVFAKDRPALIAAIQDVGPGNGTGIASGTRLGKAGGTRDLPADGGGQCFP